MRKLKQKRNRGVIITPIGLKKLQEAKFAWEQEANLGRTYTYEQISELTSLDISTIKKILKNHEGVDKRSLIKLYSAFNLQLNDKFYTKPNSNSQQRQYWGEAITVEHFVGRNQELNILSKWLLQDFCRVVTILGMGGIGKTTLSIKLAQQIGSQFEFVIWKSLRDAPPVEETVAHLIDFFSEGRETAVNLPSRLGERISRLIDYLRRGRCLILFDNAESLMNDGHRAGRYLQEYEGYGELIRRLGATKHNSSVVITSREKTPEIAVLEGDRLPVRSLKLAGLKEGCEIIKTKGLSGTNLELTALSDRYDGNPLAIKVVATTIKEIFAGNIAEFLQEERTIFGDIRELLDQQLARLSTLEQEIMYWLAIIREPVSLNRLRDNLVIQVSPIKLLEALESLSRRSLIEKNAALFTQQSVVMEYLTTNLVESVSQEIIEQRLYLFCNHALMKASAKDYIRENQIRLVLQPVINELRRAFRSKRDTEACLQQILQLLHETTPGERCYAAGNIINLLHQMGVDLTGYDFSNLCVWQADLRHAKLYQVNFQNSDLTKSCFAENFGGIWSVDFSPDGQYLAAGDTKGTIFLRNVADNQIIRRFEGHHGWVVSLKFSPDGQMLASGSCDCTAKLWDVNTGRCLHTLREHEQEVWSVAFSPDGTTLASGCDDHKTRLWNIHTGKRLKTFQGHKNEVLSVAFSLDGQQLITGSHDNTIKLWNIKTQECLQVFQGHEDGVRSVSISPDGTMLASSSNDRTIRLWNIKNGKCLKILQGHKNAVFAVSFSPQGNLIASSSVGQKIRLWNATTGECLKVFQGHSNMVNSIVFHPQGGILASGSYDQSIKLWDLKTYQCVKTLQGYSNQALAVTFSPDAQTLVSGGHDEKIRLWDIKTGKVVRTLHEHTNWVFSVAFSQNCSASTLKKSGKRVLASGSADKTIKIWDVSTGKVIKTLQGHEAAVRSIIFASDGQTIASGSDDGTIRIWDIDTGRNLKILREHQAEIWSIALNPDGRILASASIDGTVKLWEVQTGKCLKTLSDHKSWVLYVAFSSDNNTLATTSSDQTIRLWNINTGECEAVLRDEIGHSLLVAFSNDGQILASCRQDHKIRLWHTSNREYFKTLQGHQALINSIAFSPDGDTLASSSEDETIKIWDLKSGQCVKTLRPKNPYEGMLVSGVSGLSQPAIEALKILGAKTSELKQINDSK
ncbi:MAG: NB-ARC domain-containing protein [Cyanobacteria bacterium J06621_8]